METLIRARPFIVVAFFVALGGVFASPFANGTWLMTAAVSIAHVALLLFLATESFGRIAQGRSGASRWAARIFFALSALVVGPLVANLLLRLLA